MPVPESVATARPNESEIERARESLGNILSSADAISATALGVNPIIARLADNERVFYMDIGDRFLAADGTIPTEIMADCLHPTERGYEIWADAVQEKLTELLR